MSKNKNTDTFDTITDNIQKTGLGLMALAATFGVVELPHSDERRAVVLPHQPAFATVTEVGGEHNNPVRREKENEVTHAHVSYSSVQRTPARSGKQ